MTDARSSSDIGSKIGIGHERKQCSSVTADSFSDGAAQLVVGPVADAGFWVGSDIRGIYLPGEVSQEVHVLARAERIRHERRVVRRPVVLRVAVHAVGHVLDQICRRVPGVPACFRTCAPSARAPAAR